MDVRFTNEHGALGVGDVVGILEKPRLWVPGDDYPDYFDWLQKVEAELSSERKRAMLAYAGREPVGVVLYQKHKTRPATVEIKNISMSPDVRQRRFGGFMLRNTEIEALQVDFPGCTDMVVDTKATNTDMIGFLLNQGYQPTEVADLYGLGTGADIIFKKQIAFDHES